jgi:methanogenic corrinoid protein MtbC1
VDESHDEASECLPAGRFIERDIANLAKLAVDRQFKASAEMRKDLVGDRYRKCIEDTEYPFMALAQALLVDEPALFVSYVVWSRIVLANLGLPDAFLTGSLMAMRDTLVAALPHRSAEASVEYIDISLEALKDASAELPRMTSEGAPLASVAVGYLEALLAGDRAAAAGIVGEAVAGGAVLPDIYEHVFRVTQDEVGRMWQSNRLSVAMEHFATGATEAIMAQLCVPEPPKPAVARRFLGACAEGEQHDMAIRMVCDILRSHGWETFFLGASTPESALVEAVDELRPPVVGLSVTTRYRLRQRDASGGEDRGGRGPVRPDRRACRQGGR